MSDAKSFKKLVADYVGYDQASKKYDRDKALRLVKSLGMPEWIVLGWASGARVPDLEYLPIVIARIQEFSSPVPRWVLVSQWISAAFSVPCKGRYCYPESNDPDMGCNSPDEQHGHIELMDHDANYCTFIRFRCYSQTGVKAVVEFNNSLRPEEKNGILNLAEVKALPEELTEEEKVIISSPDEMEALAKDRVWWG